MRFSMRPPIQNSSKNKEEGLERPAGEGRMPRSVVGASRGREVFRQPRCPNYLGPVTLRACIAAGVPLQKTLDAKAMQAICHFDGTVIH